MSKFLALLCFVSITAVLCGCSETTPTTPVGDKQVNIDPNIKSPKFSKPPTPGGKSQAE